MTYTDDDFDETERASYYLDAGNDPDNLALLPETDAGDDNREPDPCPVRHQIFLHAKTVGEMMDALKLHNLEYCEVCGQFDGFRRAA